MCQCLSSYASTGSILVVGCLQQSPSDSEGILAIHAWRSRCCYSSCLRPRVHEEEYFWERGASTRLVAKGSHACSHRQLFVEQRSSLGCSFVCLNQSQKRRRETPGACVCTRRNPQHCSNLQIAKLCHKRYLEIFLLGRHARGINMRSSHFDAIISDWPVSNGTKRTGPPRVSSCTQ